MLKASLLFLMVIFSGTANAQTLSYNWASKGGQSADDCVPSSIVMDVQGNTYLLINYKESVTFGSLTLPSTANSNIAVVKFDPAGAVQWFAQASGSDPNKAVSIVADASGAIYISGWYTNQVNFGSIALNFGGSNPGNARQQFFLAKLNSAGLWQWANQQTGDASSKSTALALDAFGNIYTGGNYFGSLQVGNETIETEEQVPFIAKYSATGQFSWLRGAETLFGARLDGIACAPNGNVYYTGSFGTVEAESVDITFGTITLTNEGDLDLGLTASDIYAVALSSSGTYLWAVNAGSILYESFASSIVADGNNNAYLAGTFQEEISNGTQTLQAAGPEGDVDVFAAAIAPTGDWLWISRAGNASVNNPPGLAVAGGDHVYMYGNLDNDPFILGTFTLTASNGNLGYVSRLNADGTWLWAFTTPSLTGITAATGNNFRITGNFSGTINPGTFNLTASGTADVYAASLAYTPQNPEVISSIHSDNQSFPQPFQNSFRITNGKEKPLRIKMMDASGRDIPSEYSVQQDCTIVQIAEGLAPGVYFVLITYTDKTTLVKTIKAGS